MASSSSSLSVNSEVSSIRRKRKKRIDKKSRNETANLLQSTSETQWRSESQQQVYSSKLLRALQQVRLSGGGGGGGGGGSASGNQTTISPKQVRNAADRVLSATAKGRSRWSRAIISSPSCLKPKKLPRNNAISKAQGKASSSRSRKKSNPPSVSRSKARLLGRLVPGCRKQPLPVILEETIDYIPALEMQVRAMSSLLEVLSSSSSNMAVDDGHL